MNRRTILRAVGAMTSSCALSAIVEDAIAATPTVEPLSPHLAKALAAHRRALDVADEAHEAIHRCCAAHAEDLVRNPIMYVTSIGPMQSGEEGHRCPDYLGRVTPGVYQDARRMRVRKAFAAPQPNPLYEAEALYQSDLAAMAEAEQVEERRWVATDGPVLEQADQDAAADERRAWAAFLAAPALTSADVEAKISHVLVNAHLTSRSTRGQGDDGVALLKSLVGGRA